MAICVAHIHMYGCKCRAVFYRRVLVGSATPCFSFDSPADLQLSTFDKFAGTHEVVCRLAHRRIPRERNNICMKQIPSPATLTDPILEKPICWGRQPIGQKFQFNATYIH
jgi:hypothetical protein